MQFFARRLSFYLVAFLIAATINFFLPRIMPGDPLAIMFGPQMARMSPETIDAMRDTFGFSDAPLIQQYFQYIVNVFQWDLGVSTKFFPKPVSEVLADGLVWTLFLVGSSTIISFLIGSFLGLLAAWFRGSIFDSLATPGALVMQSIPSVVICLVALIIFGIGLNWLPTGYGYDTSLDPQWTFEFAGSVLKHSILPIGTLVVFQMAGFLIPMRANMINLLGEDYITMGRAKGLSGTRVMFTYGARNALLPSMTTLAMALGFVVGGSFITEVVFNYPGIGYIMFQAILARDYPLVQGHMLIFTMVMLTANFLADLLYVVLDPRVRHGGEA